MNAQDFGQFLQQRRKELGLTQTDLAGKLHVTDKAISRWERGVGFPDIKLLEPLAAALEISLAELLQCRRIEMEEDLELMEEQTQQILEEQTKLSWQRRVILYLGYAVIVSMSFILLRISRNEALQGISRYLIYAIAMTGAFLGSRALEFIVGRFWMKSKPWGIWHNYYTWITAAIILAGLTIVKLHGKFPYPWDFIALLGGIVVAIAGLIYYELKKEEEE